ncbi:MAG: hypothetical protein HC819_13905 [Cyclobacteriaceae bacterium]|nr:hypothetical protein [Cyclobacteriaceae bacterium]
MLRKRSSQRRQIVVAICQLLAGNGKMFILFTNPAHPAILPILVQTVAHPAILPILVQTVAHPDSDSLQWRLPYAVIANGAFRVVWQSVGYWQGGSLQIDRDCRVAMLRKRSSQRRQIVVAICQLLAENYEDHCFKGSDLYFLLNPGQSPFFKGGQGGFGNIWTIYKHMVQI